MEAEAREGQTRRWIGELNRLPLLPLPPPCHPLKLITHSSDPRPATTRICTDLSAPRKAPQRVPIPPMGPLARWGSSHPGRRSPRRPDTTVNVSASASEAVANVADRSGRRCGDEGLMMVQLASGAMMVVWGRREREDCIEGMGHPPSGIGRPRLPEPGRSGTPPCSLLLHLLSQRDKGWESEKMLLQVCLKSR